MIVRAFDILISLLVLLLLAPIFVFVGFAVVIDSGLPVLYKQQRVGLAGHVFKILKFRTMRNGSDKQGLITVGERDNRVTRVGFLLRKYKIDELPQFFNVLVGDMSIVGPRPEVSKYVEQENAIWRKILSVRPGITDYASIEFRNENELLEGHTDVDRFYREEILPEKNRLNLLYVEHPTLRNYLRVIVLTLVAIVRE